MHRRYADVSPAQREHACASPPRLEVGGKGSDGGTKHASASAAARRGVRLEVLAQALGHAQIGSTLRYARLHPMASLSLLRPECNVSATKIESAN
jgi:hypothetical protein